MLFRDLTPFKIALTLVWKVCVLKEKIQKAAPKAGSIWIAKESYVHACEHVLAKKRKRDKIWISAETWSMIHKSREIQEKKGAARSERLIRNYQ